MYLVPRELSAGVATGDPCQERNSEKLGNTVLILYQLRLIWKDVHYV